MAIRVLFVDDEVLWLRALKRMLPVVAPSLEASFAEAPVQALEILHEESFDVVVSDFSMPVMNGEEFLRRVKAGWPHTRRAMISSTAKDPNGGAAEAYIVKTGDVAEMSAKLLELFGD